jgi:hypothetical protein
MIFSYLFLFIMLLVAVWYKVNEAKIIGFAGERQVIKTLKSLDQNSYIILNDLYIPKENNQTSQIDHIVISSKGIFVIETKNYKGWIFGSENSPNWMQVNHKRKDKFYNPIWQNSGHILALKNYLGEIIEGAPFYSIIVFGQRSDLKFKEPFNKAIVIKRQYLLKTIKETQEINPLSNFKMQQINQKLSKIIVIDKKKKKEFAKNHVQNIKQELHEKKAKVQNGNCPSCGGNLVKRKGKYGDFKGCSNYPKCKYTA